MMFLQLITTVEGGLKNEFALLSMEQNKEFYKNATMARLSVVIFLIFFVYFLVSRGVSCKPCSFIKYI
jgi:hypothetical protein